MLKKNIKRNEDVASQYRIRFLLNKIIFCLIFCLFNLIFCHDRIALASQEVRESNDQDLVLLEEGYNQEIIDAMTENEEDIIYEAACEEAIIDKDIITMEVDNFNEISDFLSYDHDGLIELGLTEEEISNASERINYLINQSDDQLRSKFGLDDAEIKMLRGIVEENGRKDKIIETPVYGTGTIGEAKLTYAQTVVQDYNSKNPKYNVVLAYAWHDPFAVGLFSDKIAVAWGGNLNSRDERGSSKYYNMNTLCTKYTSYVKSKNMSVNCQPNKGIIFSFTQTDNNYHKIKKGSASFTLFQSKKAGKSTKIVSSYCHKKFAVAGSVSISKNGPGISIGTGWDYSKQKNTNISY